VECLGYRGNFVFLKDLDSDMRNSLEIRNLSVERSNREIIKDLSLSLTEGNLVHLKGANGSGKTTFLRALAGLINPSQGGIFWNESNISENIFFQSILNYVSHNLGLADELTALENLSFLRSISRKTPNKTVEASLEIMNLKNFQDCRIAILSAGQKQRASLAQLLMFNCPLWLLDEPFNSLDAESCGVVESLIDDHMSNGGIAIVASHQKFQSSTAQHVVEL
jgi:heme exporter protein A